MTKINLRLSSIAVTSLTALGLVAFSPTATFAQTASPSPTAQNANQATRMATIKSKADAQIQMRLTSLNSVLSKINAATKLSSSDKANFSSEIQTDITNLQALQAKIDADTDLATLRADAKSIYTDFRIYAVFLPQVHELAAVDTMGVAVGNLTTLAGKLQARIQTAQSSGQNVSNLQSLLTDMNAQISNAQSQYSGVESEISSLTPASYPGSTAILKDASSKIKAGAADLKAAWQDAKQIVQGLKALRGNTQSPSPSPSV